MTKDDVRVFSSALVFCLMYNVDLALPTVLISHWLDNNKTSVFTECLGNVLSNLKWLSAVETIAKLSPHCYG